MSQSASDMKVFDKKALVLKGMQAAIAARAKANFDQKSPICVYALSEAYRVTVRFNEISMEGMYDRAPKPRIHVSAMRPLARRNFTCAHELGHHVFQHGSSIDELRTDQAEFADRPPNEVLADAFAAFTLMPTVGLREAFSRRNLLPERASPADLYAIACNFGVGQSTLVNHLAYGIGAISVRRRDTLGKTTPKAIRSSLLGEIVPEHLTYADNFWTSSTMDTEEGSLLLLPRRAVVDTEFLMPEHEVPQGCIFRTMKVGISRVVIPGTSWSTYVRIARRQYVGLARYRHLEES